MRKGKSKFQNNTRVRIQNRHDLSGFLARIASLGNCAQTQGKRVTTVAIDDLFALWNIAQFLVDNPTNGLSSALVDTVSKCEKQFSTNPLKDW